MDLNVIDNFFSETKHRSIHEYCLNAAYTYGESDEDGLPVTGMVHEVNEFIYNLMDSTIRNRYNIKNMNVYRMYINCFAPCERPYFHKDGDKGEVTFLYYPNMEWDKDDGGETQFLTERDILGVLPIPNRMVS